MRIRAVLVLLTEPYTGGGFQYTLNVLKAFEALADDRYERTIVCRSPAWSALVDGKRSTLLMADGTTVERMVRKACFLLPGGRWLWSALLWRISALERTVDAVHPQIILYSAAEPVTLSFRFPTVVPIHDLMHRYERSFPEVSNPKSFRSREFVNSTLCRYAAGVLVDSEVGKHQLMESYGIDASRVFVLPYTVPPYVANGSAAPWEEVRERFQLPPDYLFYPAQFWQHKNHRRLIAALGLLRQRGHSLHLLLCGSDKNAQQDLHAEAERCGVKEQVRILPYVDNETLLTLYAHAQALVMPTFFGPTNIPPLEAFAMGCPAIVSDIYGMREQLGDAALYFDPKDERQIADRIEALVTDPALRASLIARGAERARQWQQKDFTACMHGHLRTVVP